MVHQNSNTVNQPEIIDATPKSAPTSTYSSTPASTYDVIAILAFIVGLINLCSWFFWLCGLIFTLSGITLGIIGARSEKYKVFAYSGLAISIIAFLLTVMMACLALFPFLLTPFMGNNYSF